ncbi:MAG: hypothetical protein PHT07_20780 [Paludibacter sp.]|nr:hypothetical protein [Paludibacter sp.]
MSGDLISRKALLKETEKIGSGGMPGIASKQYVQTVITNAPAVEQGEDVYWVYEIEKGRGIYQGVTGQDSEQVVKECALAFESAGKPFPLFSTPPQPQSVKDALEKAVELCDSLSNTYHNRREENDAYSHVSGGCDFCADAIRALIEGDK